MRCTPLRFTSDGNADRKRRVYGIYEHLNHEKVTAPNVGRKYEFGVKISATHNGKSRYFKTFLRC